MNRATTLFLITMLAGCISPRQTLSLRTDARLQGGAEAAVRFEAPEGWAVVTKKADKVELAAPDNFSRATVTAVPVIADASSCPALARRAAEDAAADLKKGANVRPEVTEAQRDAFDFRLSLPGNPPGPSDRLAVGRAICRDGALAVATCSSGVRRPEMAKTCDGILASLTVEPASGAAAPAPAAPSNVIVPRPGTAPIEQPNRGQQAGEVGAPAGEQPAPAEQPKP